MEYIKKKFRDMEEERELSLTRITLGCNRENEGEAVFEETKPESFSRLLEVINPEI